MSQIIFAAFALYTLLIMAVMIKEVLRSRDRGHLHRMSARNCRFYYGPNEFERRGPCPLCPSKETGWNTRDPV